jgi:hypothetical protein
MALLYWGCEYWGWAPTADGGRMALLYWGWEPTAEGGRTVLLYCGCEYEPTAEGGRTGWTIPGLGGATLVV